MGSTTVTCLICTAAILGLCTIVLVSVAVATDWWQEFRVNRTALTNLTRAESDTQLELGRIAHSRNRGLFRECYPGNDTKFLDTAPNKVDSFCFLLGYEFAPGETGSEEKMLRYHLMRCVAAFFLLSGVFFLSAYVVGLCVCHKRRRNVAFCAGIVAYFAAFFVAGAMAFWHGVEYVERNRITGNPYFYQGWPNDVRLATWRQFHWSYYCGWVGMILAAITASIYFIIGCIIKDDRYDDPNYMDKRGVYPGYQIPLSPIYTIDDPYGYNYAQPVVYAASRPPGTPRGGYYHYDNAPAVADGTEWGWKVVA